MEFQMSSGHVFYLNNLITFVIFMGFLGWLSYTINAKKFDKFLHSIISAGLTLLLIWPFDMIHVWWLSPIIVMAIGFGKEFLDYFNPKKKLFDWTDILADAIGVGAVTLFFFLTFVLHMY